MGRGHECRCAEGFEGSYCQYSVDDCDSAPCLNGGKCRNLRGNGAYSCECPVGFQGKQCEHNINDCAHGPCQNGGTCYDLVNDFKCACPKGTMGLQCEINVDDCFEGKNESLYVFVAFSRKFYASFFVLHL